MLVTFHAIWYVIRDITFHIIQAMEDAKRDETAA